MANTFLRKTSKNIGTSYFQVGANLAGLQGNGNPQTGAYTVGSNTTTTVIGLSVANVTGTSVEVDVALSATMANTTNDVALASSVPIPSGSVLVLVGGDQKLNLATSDVVMSILEIT